ncbi:class I SAM-dependent methyltransferase [Nocardiopsis sp. NPDC101807]|uniref:class I SAM-dependent methyltransferase n=1 Tax=Nocardiopsis sp. NPDC101807 TaxID=3364339 RepID=UPI003818D105
MDASSWDAALDAWRPPAPPVSAQVREAALQTALTDDADATGSPSFALARRALSGRASVLDVGCGAGRASVALAADAPGTALTGVDPSAALLGAFAARARGASVPVRTVLGAWPEAAARTPSADVVVCHHVLYYTASLVPFARALTDRARRRVVVEIPWEHPHAWMRPLWSALGAPERPDPPTAPGAARVLRDLGLRVRVEGWTDGADPWRGREEALVRHVCDRLGSSDTDRVRALLDEYGLPPRGRRTATLWWPAP